MISVIIPVYNTQDFLDECINSIVNQTYNDFEIILVNDGSTDNSVNICRQWAKKDSRITVVEQKNQGVSAARNNGISHAKGEYLYFIDSDDYVDTNLFADVMHAFEQGGADIVSFGAQKIFENAPPQLCDNLYTGDMTPIEAVEKLVSADMKDYPWSRVYKREIFDNLQFPVGHYFEDTGTTYKAFLNASKIHFIPKVYYCYRVRKNSIISDMSDSALKDIFLMRKQRYDDLVALYPQVAECGFEYIAIAALRFYDRSLWSNVDKNALSLAQGFLTDNKEKVLASSSDIIFKLYYFSPCAYKCYRLLKHKIGNIVKKIKAQIK